MSNEDLKLAAVFEPASEEAWRELVERALGERDFDKVMTAETYDGIRVQGLYSQGNARVSGRPQGRVGAWGVIVPHWNPDTSATNDAILEDLARGATGVALRLQAGRFPGVPVEKMAQALDGVYLNMASFTLVPGEEFSAAARTMLTLLEERGHNADDVYGKLGADPLGTLAQTGRLKTSLSAAVGEAVDIASFVAERYPHVSAFMADSGPYHMAGATEAQELGILIATGVSYLRAMVDAGMDVRAAANQITFSMAADADVSLTIAKFRAARLMWAAVMKECGLEDAPRMALSGVSSLRMMSVKDPWVNILRATAACFGAGIGGADDICILPHDSMIGMSSSFARRIARNLQIILQEESGLSRVQDPAAGSYAFESITSDLASKAWEYFQKIESVGGLEKALAARAIQQDLAVSWATRRANLAKRKDAITGVSEFPDIDEKPISNVGAMPAEPADLPPAGVTIEPLAFHRLAEDFEKLRAFSDACLEKDGSRPLIYLANIGSAADYTARATFAKNFFEAGGIKSVNGTGGNDAEAVAEEFKASGAKLAVICSSDSQYDALGQDFAVCLRKAGAHVYLAGRPLNSEELKLAGVEEFIYMGCDVLEVLAQAHVMAGASS
ncbi:methylmalonyl-CoA mutase family protein [Kordiimonas lipolytica]|uniref:Methylmalonyl-CoA mutase family protein n=1 Tax=Kordiimonas lipolytica TaxID=1662421 RepID=A0ABV8UA55_9PROT|nr:methylmalonyl-CoA mutase family protein [Kordiimonas lipolytica]